MVEIWEKYASEYGVSSPYDPNKTELIVFNRKIKRDYQEL